MRVDGDASADELNLQTHYDNVQILLSKASSGDRATDDNDAAMDSHRTHFVCGCRLSAQMEINYLFMCESDIMYHLV